MCAHLLYNCAEILHVILFCPVLISLFCIFFSTPRVGLVVLERFGFGVLVSGLSAVQHLSVQVSPVQFAVVGVTFVEV